MLLTSILRAVIAQHPPKTRRNGYRGHDRKMEDLAKEVGDLFGKPIQLRNLLSMSQMFQIQFDERLQYSPVCMLPSYNHTLPTGKEEGSFLTVDVGGSTLRVALVNLSGRESEHNGMNVTRMESSEIDEATKQLVGQDFFDWMAEKIQEFVAADDSIFEGRDSLPMGLAWSFPFDQTSLRSGSLLNMGKGFHCAEGLVGHDLRELIMQACDRKGLKVRLEAIVNDSLAALLAHAYTDSSTRLATILGTGTNAAIQLPVTCIGKGKFGERPQNWFDQAHHVVVNSELGMFGKGILPFTRWDDRLNAAHQLPDYQPYEYMITGRYIGELVRLILVEATETAGLFGGEMPVELREPYSLDCATVGRVEADKTSLLTSAAALLQSQYTFTTPPTYRDLAFVRTVCQHVSHRAAALFAMGLHSLWRLRLKTRTPRTEKQALTDPSYDQLTISCNGSVINKYTGFRRRCQEYLDFLADMDGGHKGSMILEPTPDSSSVLGAAVAVAIAEQASA